MAEQPLFGGTTRGAVDSCHEPAHVGGSTMSTGGFTLSYGSYWLTVVDCGFIQLLMKLVIYHQLWVG